MLGIWKKQYTLRRYSAQKIKRGYATRSYTDMLVMLDVQPVMNDSQPTESGKRVTQRITAYGTFPIRVENVREGIQADRLFFEGAWFECEKSMMYEHTPLAHYTTDFVRVSEAIPDSDIIAPTNNQGGSNEV